MSPSTAPRRAVPVLVLSAATGLALVGCSAPVAESSSDSLSIVASTNVYGDIAASIAGDLATVTSIIDSPAQDPHSYEASAQVQLAIADADLVIENGGGYDPFIDLLVDGSDTDAAVVTAVVAGGALEEGEEAHSEEEAGDNGQGHEEGANEHVWYDVHAMSGIAAAISEALIELDPDNAATYEQNLTDLEAELESVEAELARLADELGGGVVASTEPVPAYLLAELGLDDETPEEFLEAVEEGADVPPLALQQTFELLDSGEVRLLAYNEQTASPETERIREAAEAASIPVVSFTETLPDAEDYVSWMRANLAAVGAALSDS
ncbi:metal ABC transporter solute-binding protein, Zn/Mn family [Microcella flavibacter]|uniref:metal ABC transporter solute-binding protein, Zn/Mn family n=1 Tax=Microcella flavibacter TaxID=1804990 RepID=UPI0014564AFD|nr:zinc ABC transporter substrate-binding protein [Microcella flavibacter]